MDAAQERHHRRRSTRSSTSRSATTATPPLAYTHNRVEGRTEYTQLLYIPAKAPFDLWNRDKRGGVKLYVKRVFIMDDAEALMPVYLRFVKGVIDSADLPLNVSPRAAAGKPRREGDPRRLDQARAVDARRPGRERRTRTSTPRFWNEFGAVLKEGVGEDHANQERLAKLLRFASTHADEGVSLADYVGRMKEGQEAIYYITADTLAAAKSSPQLEIFRKKGIEVLLLADRVDEWMLSHLYEFDGHALQSVAKGAVDLGKLQDEDEKKQAEAAAEAFKPLLERLKATLKDRAKDVRVTTRLVDSPACIVVEEGDMSAHLARLLKQAGQDAPKSSRSSRSTPQHRAGQAARRRRERFDDLAHILFDQAWLAEGGQLEDPADYVQRVTRCCRLLAGLSFSATARVGWPASPRSARAAAASAATSRPRCRTTETPPGRPGRSSARRSRRCGGSCAACAAARSAPARARRNRMKAP